MKNVVHQIRLKVPQKDIYYISWNLDACEGLGLLRTDDAKEGAVTVLTPDSQLALLYDFIEGHRREGIMIEIENIDEMREYINEN